ncbi:MAG: hypothetical protein FWG64_12780 [Firmicutes bacterium]|nr:hypothetical protein [Bacillota bacterium]
MKCVNVLRQENDEFERECLAISRSTLLPIIEKYDIKLLLTEPDNFDNLLFNYKNGKYLTEAVAARCDDLVNWGYWVNDTTIKITKGNVSIANHKTKRRETTLVQNTYITKIDVFAGPHPRTGKVDDELRDIEDLETLHEETKPKQNPITGRYERSKWYHASGQGLVWYKNERLEAEIHWFGHPDLDGVRGRTSKYELEDLWYWQHLDE